MIIALAGVASALRRNVGYAIEEAKARQRVRQAEDKLADAVRTVPVGSGNVEIVLRPEPPNSGDQMISGRDIFSEENGPEDKDDLAAVGDGFDSAPDLDAEPGPTIDTAVVEQLFIQRPSDALTLAALWDVTHGRMDLYHQIVTGQARRSFGAAQVAMGIGFVLLVGFAVLAAEAKTTAAAISAGGLGAVGAAFAAYIGKTFIRSQESAASHLRAYFDQPLELSRYLAAERLLADAKDLKPEQHAAIISALVQSIATAGQPGEKAKNANSTGRQPRGRASR